MTTIDTRPHTPILTWVYGALAVVGLVGTWTFNLRFGSTGDGASYLGSWFANDASSSAAVDIIVAGVAACVLYVREGRRLGWSWWAIGTLVVLSFALAVAFTFPLFLALRERTLTVGRVSAPPRRSTEKRSQEPEAHSPS